MYYTGFEWKELARVGVVKHLSVERKESENNLIVILSTIKWKGGTESSFASLGKKPLPEDLLSSIRPLASHFLLSSLRRFWMQSKNRASLPGQCTHPPFVLWPVPLEMMEAHLMWLIP